MTTETNHHYFNGHAESAPQSATQQELMTRGEAIDWLTAAEHGWHGQLKFLDRMREELADQGPEIQARIDNAMRALIALNDAREELIDVLNRRVYRVCVSMRSEHVCFVQARDEYAAKDEAEYYVNRNFSAEFDNEHSMEYEVIESALLDNDDHADEFIHCEA